VKGEVVYYFAFDVANELLAETVQRLLGDRCARYKPHSRHAAPSHGSLSPPLAITPRASPPALKGVPTQLEIRVYEFGAISVVLRVPFEVAALGELSVFHDAVLADGRKLEQMAVSICAEVCREIQAALIRPSEPREPETYTVFCLHDLGGAADTERWLGEHRPDVAGLLLNRSPARLSTSQIDEALRQIRSMEKTDAVVLDWDAALVVDLGGHADDLLFVIELTNLQLEEFRQMDRALDLFMNQAYADLEHRSIRLFGKSAAVLRKLRWFRIDLAKLADEVTNTTKFFGDWHLARVYLAARERFHLDQWRDSVEERLAQIDQLYNLVSSEVSERRMFILELIIGLLILIELLSGLGLFRR
jgi:hypothetical protein